MPSPGIFKLIRPEHLDLRLSQPPYPQANTSAWSIRDVVYPDYNLFICLEGSGIFRLDDRPYKISTGHAVLVAPGERVFARKTSRGRLHMLAQHFNLRIFSTADFFNYIDYRSCIRFKDWPIIRACVSDITAKVRRAPDLLYLQPPFFTILVNFIREACLGDKKVINNKLDLVLRMMDLVSRDPASRDLLHDVFALSPYGYSHTYNLFKKYTGDSPKTFIQKRRLEAARNALLDNKTVRQAASVAGFDDEKYFSRLFRKYEGVSPSVFRDQTGFRF